MRRRRLGRGAFGVISLGALALVLAACSGPENGQNSLQPKGKYAKQIDDLFIPIAFIAVAIGILVVGATIVAAVKFRHRPGQPDNPKQVHGHAVLEIAWTLVPALIMVGIGVPTVSTIFSLSQKPENPVTIEVVGKQWWWEFVYPGGGEDQVVTANEMHIPTGRDIFLKLRACDDSLPGECNVIHSFWVPELAGKTDVVPGMVNTMKLRADTAGTYLGQCAEYCGLSHANMRVRVIAESPDDFDAWLSSQRDGPAVPLTSGNDEPAGEAQRLFSKRFACTGCHTTEDASLSTYGPNLTHFASRTTFASGWYKLTRARLIEWILDAPSLIPMESQDCRLGLGVEGVTCVGMPSFTTNTPPGMPVMTRAEAEEIADYLLELT